jgi:hypothetical protein
VILSGEGTLHTVQRYEPLKIIRFHSYPEDGCSRFLQNVCICVPNYTTEIVAIKTGTITKDSLPSGSKVKNDWSYTNTPPIRLHGVDRDNFNLYDYITTDKRS